MELAELAAWLRLSRSHGVGSRAALKLLACFGSPEQVFAASAKALRSVVDETTAAALEAEPEGWRSSVEQTQSWLDRSALHHVVVLGDAAYPPAWLNIDSPPMLLFAQGRIDLMAGQSLAVVGSRNATAQGLQNARSFSAHLGQAGLTIVSGLALGIDGAAHEGALSVGAGTIAIVGTGLDRVYPRRHLDLAHHIAEQGLMVSEYWLGTEPLAANFPRRNRLIAGLCLGTLVVEAAPQSGSLFTAKMASEAGREVFAIPGSIHSPQSRGCHWLIKQGAKLVETANDILEELRLQPAPAYKATEAEATHRPDEILNALGHDPVTLDALSARTGWPVARLNERLLELELEGEVSRLPGGLFQRQTSA